MIFQELTNKNGNQLMCINQLYCEEGVAYGDFFTKPTIVQAFKTTASK
ncbi:hypothetical protein EDC32_10464 [Laceyella sacchari]|nr:hypothetical protein EDC32_10464 [Laceyella sacchari]